MSSLATEDRSPVKLEQIPQVMLNAVISIEDRKFYEHHGVDWAGTTRALFKNVDAGGISQGGSTITQQLVKNTFSIGRKRDLTTKAREAFLAVKLEEQMTKSQILEDYMNLVYFGNGAYGIQAAVERYFPFTTLAKLDLAQSALLAGLIQSPEALNPVKHPGAAARRRSEVLDAMVVNGKTTAAAAKLAKSVPLPTTVSYPHTGQLDYYMDEVKNVMLNDDPNTPGDPAEVLGATQQARANAVFRGGLKVYTSYDPTLQFEATAAVNKVLPKSPFTASLVVIDNADGGVRAIANGRTFTEMQFDPATEGPGRQAGSSFKVFTLAAALTRGYSANDRVSTAPLTWRLDQGSGSNSFYHIGGSGDDCGGDTPTLTRAIARSDNCAFMRTELSLGPGNFGSDGVKAVIQTAKSMGIDTSNFNPSVVSTTLGTQGVHPLDMARGVLRVPERRRAQAGDVHHQDRRPRRQDDLPGADERHSGARPERGPHRDEHARGCVAQRNRELQSRDLPASGGGQDRHHRPQPGRLVRRLHAAVHGRGLDGQSRGRDPDDERRRHHRVRCDVSRPDLAHLHAGCGGAPPGGRLHPAGAYVVRTFATHHRARPEDQLLSHRAAADIGSDLDPDRHDEPDRHDGAPCAHAPNHGSDPDHPATTTADHAGLDRHTDRAVT